MQLNRPLATITPTLDGDILAVLAQHEVTFTAGQLHRIIDRYSEEGIRKVLLRLARQGIVQSTKVGAAHAYQLNREHLAADSIIQLAHLAQALFLKIEKYLEDWDLKPQYAAIFGSAARGTMSDESDIDILLVRPDNAQIDIWDAQVSALTSDVSRWTGNDVRPLEYTASELLAARDELVVRDVMRDGLTVAGRRAWLIQHLRQRSG
jgi:predicted nucleotidyltransferase